MTDDAPAVKAWWATTPLSGAIGILHLEGDCEAILRTLTGSSPSVGSIALSSLAAVDKAQHSSEPTASKTNAALAQVGAAELATVGALDDGIRAALHSTMAPLRGKLGVRAA